MKAYDNDLASIKTFLFLRLPPDVKIEFFVDIVIVVALIEKWKKVDLKTVESRGVLFIL